MTNDDKSPKGPLCIRFKSSDLKLIDAVADRCFVGRSEWIRRVTLARAESIIAGGVLPSMVYRTAGGAGGMICIRYRPQAFQRIQRAAKEEGVLLPSPWIRAVVMNELSKEKTVEIDKDNSERKSSSSKRLKNRSTDGMPVLGKSTSRSSERTRRCSPHR